MSDLIQTVKEMYAAFGRGDVTSIMARVADDVVWEFEAPAEVSFAGIRRGTAQAMGYFEGIAKDHTDPKLEMTEFVGSGDAVAAFGRYEATVRATGRRFNTPVAHYFRFRDGKVVRYINLVNTAALMDAMRPDSVSAASR